MAQPNGRTGLERQLSEEDVGDEDDPIVREIDTVLCHTLRDNL